MKWSWKVATVSGIEIDLHFTFLLLLAWIALAYLQTYGTWTAVAEGVGFIVALFFCVLLHEFGHALMARRYGIATRQIVLLPIGGISTIAKTPDQPAEEMNIAVAGPLVSLAIALAIGAGLWISGRWVPLAEMAVAGEHFLPRLMVVNLLLAAFNLLPALPMDGGRVLRAALSMRMGPLRATKVAAGIAQGLAIVMALVGLRYNILLVFIALFIWFGAVSEVGLARFKSGLSGLTAGDLMLQDFHSLQADDALDRAVEITLAGTQKDFPVLSGPELAGVLRQADLLRALRDHGAACPVRKVMDTDFPSIEAEAGFDAVLERLQSSRQQPSGILAVRRQGDLVGIIDWDNILENALIREALQRNADGPWR